MVNFSVIINWRISTTDRNKIRYVGYYKIGIFVWVDMQWERCFLVEGSRRQLKLHRHFVLMSENIEIVAGGFSRRVNK
jgi:hypothetical protein